MKLTYWVTGNIDQTMEECYWLRTKTKKEAKQELGFDNMSPGERARWFGPVKVVVEYDNAFDLMQKTTGEGFYEESVCVYPAIEKAQAAFERYLRGS